VDRTESAYTSRVLPIFVQYLDNRPGARLLDVGPVCGGNIRFFASRVGKLYVCDLFHRLFQELRKGRSASHIWTELDYPVGCFDAVQLWNLGDHLADRDFTRLVELCILMLKPGGVLMLIAVGEESGPLCPHAFAVGEGFRLEVRVQPEPKLPLHHRHNRDLIAMMNPFKLVKSFIYRSGLREFLFEHP
jgi:hypothetical protein